MGQIAQPAGADRGRIRPASGQLATNCLEQGTVALLFWPFREQAVGVELVMLGFFSSSAMLGHAMALFLGIFGSQAHTASEILRHGSGALPKPIETGLGDCIDFMLYGSASMTEQVHRVYSQGYAFLYANRSVTDRRNKKIYIERAGRRVRDQLSPAYPIVRLVTHELGHAAFPFRANLSSRKKYIESNCENEGLAFSNNVLGRDEIFEISRGKINMGLATAKEKEIESLYRSNTSDLKRVGMFFCRNNITSNTRENYIDYYGKQYDKIKGGKSVIAKLGENHRYPPLPEADKWRFFQMLDRMAAHAKQGAESTLSNWPGISLDTPVRINPYFRMVKSQKRFNVSKNIQITNSEIRMGDNGMVLIELNIAPDACISEHDLHARYPSLEFFLESFDKSPRQMEYWDMTNDDGRISFGFSALRPGCVSSVVINSRPDED